MSAHSEYLKWRECTTGSEVDLNILWSVIIAADQAIAATSSVSEWPRVKEIEAFAKRQNISNMEAVQALVNAALSAGLDEEL